jgi:hypothetical protein
MAKTVTIDAAALPSGATAAFREIATLGGLCFALATAPTADHEEYDEEDVTIYCAEFKLKAKLLSKTVDTVTTYYGLTSWTKEAYASGEKRLLLQVGEPSTGTFTLGLDKGYLKE